MNWQALILALRASGLSLTRIARAVHAPVSTISEIAQGRSREPRGDLAVNLYRLARKRGVWTQVASSPAKRKVA